MARIVRVCNMNEWRGYIKYIIIKIPHMKKQYKRFRKVIDNTERENTVSSRDVFTLANV